MGNNYKEYQRQYQERYREEHKDYWKNYYEESKGNYVYAFMDSQDYPIYVGSTNNVKYRCSLHLTGNSNIGLDKEELEELYDFERVVYWSFEGFNRADTLYIEQLLINKYSPILNKNSSCTVTQSKLSISRDTLEKCLEEIENDYIELEM